MLFLKSISERGGSDIERRHLKSIWSRSRIPSFNFSVVVCRIRLLPTFISKIKWLGPRLPLKFQKYCKSKWVSATGINSPADSLIIVNHLCLGPVLDLGSFFQTKVHFLHNLYSLYNIGFTHLSF